MNQPTWIALGSNLGDRAAILRDAVVRLKTAGLPPVRYSHLYETRPEHGRDEPAYLNAVVQSESAESPLEILQALLRIEAELGRDLEERGGSRTCDLDLLAVGDLTLAQAELTLPHPRMSRRPFVLVPLCEIDPRWTFPGTTDTAADLLSALPYSTGEVMIHSSLVLPGPEGSESLLDRIPAEGRVEG